MTITAKQATRLANKAGLAVFVRSLITAMAGAIAALIAWMTFLSPVIAEEPAVVESSRTAEALPPAYFPPASDDLGKSNDVPAAFVPLRVARADDTSTSDAETRGISRQLDSSTADPDRSLETLFRLAPLQVHSESRKLSPELARSDSLPRMNEPQRLPIPDPPIRAQLRNSGQAFTPTTPMPAWWDPMVNQPLRPADGVRYVSINGLINSALQYSSRVQVVSTTPLIADTAIIEADADFDWVAFVETSWNDVDEPVGNTLTTGGPPRFQNEKVSMESGTRRRALTGGEFEISQQYGYERSNSVFFVPNDQGTARLTLNFTQPLLRGGGRPFNTSTIVLAQLQSGVARDEFSRRLQAHLLEITESYWSLYLERGALLQRQQLFQRGQIILKDLEYRKDLDALENQLVRARAAVASRRSNLFRAATAVKNVEGRLRALVNDPQLGLIDEFELTPIDSPATFEIPISMPEAIQCAFQNRPEVAQAIKEVKSSGVRLEVAKNELLPIFDVFAEMYVNGLRGDANVGGAWEDQFSDGAPSYSTGLRLELPLGNRLSRARFQRRVLEQRQFQQQFQNTLQTLQLEIEIAVREAITSFREISAKYQAFKAAECEVEFLTQRWKLLPGDDRSVSLLLEDLLSAQERLAAEEFEYLNAVVEYNVALVNLRKTTGTLLQFEQISVAKSEACGIPQLHLLRPDSGDSLTVHGTRVADPRYATPENAGPAVPHASTPATPPSAHVPAESLIVR